MRASLLWEQDVGSSNLSTPTKKVALVTDKNGARSSTG